MSSIYIKFGLAYATMLVVLLLLLTYDEGRTPRRRRPW